MGTFEHVIVIGYGVVTGEVLSLVYKYSSKYHYSLEYIEHEVHPFNAAKKFAEANGVDHRVIEDKQALTDHFMQSAMAFKLLVISASNNYLFPKALVENENVAIINFHNALLPELPGRNAPSWAIFEGRKKTGITWHYATAGVDAGDIITQKECEIPNDIKAYELVAAQMKLAAEAFAECYESVLNGKAEVVKQVIPKNRRLYKSKEVPGDGSFDLKDDPEYIYRLLRAMDYGKNDIFPLPVTYYNGRKICIKKYKKIKAEEIKESDNKIFLPYGRDFYLMLRYDVPEPE